MSQDLLRRFTLCCAEDSDQLCWCSANATTSIFLVLFSCLTIGWFEFPKWILQSPGWSVLPLIFLRRDIDISRCSIPLCFLLANFYHSTSLKMFLQVFIFDCKFFLTISLFSRSKHEINTIVIYAFLKLPICR